MAEQNFQNHAVFPKTLVIAMSGVLIAAILAVVGLCMPSTIAGVCLIGTAALVHALFALYGLFVMRTYAVGLQDRIVRMEMRYRLDHILPEDLKARTPELTIPHLVGLRFAGDDEIVELTRWTLDNKPEKSSDIKKKVQNWQADNARV
jgi:hypothetical protein